MRMLAIRRSLFSNRKIESLLRGMCDCSCLEKLELSFCQLQSTKAIGKFLSANNTLKALELRGNYLRGNEVVDLATAINQYKGHLCYLGLSQNPIQSNGLKCILSNILATTTQVNDLDISGCQCDADDAPYIINFVQSHSILRSINLTAIPLMETNGEHLVKALREQCGILQLQCKACGLSEEQETNLTILLERNNYYEANPILRNNEVTPEQEMEIDLIMKQKVYDVCYDVFVIDISIFPYFSHRLLANKIMPDFFRKDEAPSGENLM